MKVELLEQNVPKMMTSQKPNYLSFFKYPLSIFLIIKHMYETDVASLAPRSEECVGRLWGDLSWAEPEATEIRVIISDPLSKLPPWVWMAHGP